MLTMTSYLFRHNLAESRKRGSFPFGLRRVRLEKQYFIFHPPNPFTYYNVYIRQISVNILLVASQFIFSDISASES